MSISFPFGLQCNFNLFKYMTSITTATEDQTELQTRRDTTGSFELIFLDKDGSSVEFDLPYNEFLFLASNFPILVTQVKLRLMFQCSELTS